MDMDRRYFALPEGTPDAELVSLEEFGYQADKESMIHYYQKKQDWAKREYRKLKSAQYQKNLRLDSLSCAMFLAIVASLVMGILVVSASSLMPWVPTRDSVAIFVMAEIVIFFLAYHKMDSVYSFKYQHRLSYVSEVLQKTAAYLSEF